MDAKRTQATDRLRGRVLSVLVVLGLVAATVGGYTVGQRNTTSGVAAEGAQSLADLPIELGGSRQVQPDPTGQVREFELVAQPTRWEILPGVTTDAFAYNGQVPGPTIRVTEGDILRVTLRNELDQPTTIHWHGLHVPNAMDGVPGVTQDAVPPGGTFVYEFVVSHAGTFMYHSHSNAVEQIDRGLYGVLIVDPQPGTAEATKFDREFTMMLSAWNVPSATMPNQTDDGEAAATASGDMAGMPGMEATTTPFENETAKETGGLAMQMNYNFWTINGKAYPAVPAWNVNEGDLIRVRLINISNVTHPMHLHGQDFKVVAKDGETLKPEQQYVANTLSVDAGETYDIVILAESPGAWLFHCHELHHTENDGIEPGGLIQVIQTAGIAAEATPAA